MIGKIKMEPPNRAPLSSTARLLTALVLTAALVAFITTDRWFSLLEDETAIATAARTPLAETLGLFLYGHGQHEHPPLSDLLLHEWLPVGGAAQWSLRLPSVVLYLIGLLVLALAARKIGGNSAFKALLAIGILSPFGFHFGRLVGWYSFCFFLVAVLTLAYLRYRERPSAADLVTFVFASLCLVYSNYYGWCVIICLAADVLIMGRQRKEGKLLLITFATLIIAYTPLWIAFVREVIGGTAAGGFSPAAKLLNAMYNLYSLFVSEAVAPWIWSFSIPASVCIAVSIVLAAVLLSHDRRWLVYFFLLFGGLAIMGVLYTKRLLFISDWLLLAFAIALSNRDREVSRAVLVVALACISAIGWTGIIARKYYAAPHFIEPWAEIADAAAVSLKEGTVVVSNSPAFLFDMNYALQRLGMVSRSSLPGWAEHPGLIGVERWETAGDLKPSSVLFVRGVNTSLTDQTEAAERSLVAHCVRGSEQSLVPDSGAALKARFFTEKGQQQPPFRISLQRFDCSKSRQD